MMDFLNELYILASAIFISVWFAYRIPKWAKAIYRRCKLKSVMMDGNHSVSKTYCDLYELFAIEGA